MTSRGPRSTRRRRAVWPAVLAAAWVCPAAAHDFFLLPERSSLEPGASVEIRMHVSDSFPGDPVPWRRKRTREFFLVDARGRLSLLDAPIGGDPGRARVTPRSGGSSVVVLVTHPSFIELKPEEFERYLEHEGHRAILEGVRAAAPRPAVHRERYTRFVKTMVHAGGPSDVALAEIGLPIEIVPESQPATVRPGERLPVRVLSEGRPYRGGQLCATHAGYTEEHDAYAWCGRLDDDGRAAVPIRSSGWQLLRITRMRPVEDGEEAVWESFWAALTFEVPTP
ncbi:MAG: DUF4198 domain-containing protein [Acidobacteriota bacterium]